jgi:hypothetical protein
MNQRVKIGVSDNNERNETLFCVRIYDDKGPLSKKLFEGFDEAFEYAATLINPSEIEINVRATRRMKKLILQRARAERLQVSPNSKIGRVKKTGT